MSTNNAHGLNLPKIITKYIPTIQVAEADTAINALVGAGCEPEDAARSAAVLDIGNPNTPVAAMLPGFENMDRLVVAVRLPSGRTGAFLGSLDVFFTTAADADAFGDLASKVSGKNWHCISWTGADGFGPRGWRG